MGKMQKGLGRSSLPDHRQLTSHHLHHNQLGAVSTGAIFPWHSPASAVVDAEDLSRPTSVEREHGNDHPSGPRAGAHLVCGWIGREKKRLRCHKVLSLTENRDASCTRMIDSWDKSDTGSKRQSLGWVRDESRKCHEEQTCVDLMNESRAGVTRLHQYDGMR